MKKKARRKTQQSLQDQSQARQRAEIIMKVRCSQMTATEAAKMLGVSRKTYYKWEQRGLAALMEGLQDQTAGRPETPEAVMREAEVSKQMEELKRQNELLQKKMHLKGVMHQAELSARAERAKKK